MHAPLRALSALPLLLVLAAGPVLAAGLTLDAPGLRASTSAVDLQLALPALPVAADALARDALAGTSGVLAAPFDSDAALGGGLPALLSGSSTQASSQAGGPVAPSTPLAPGAASQQVAAAGALAAAGTLALKLEPVRRGLFLLALPLYSRLRRSQLLENGVRERIYRAVESQPGLSIIQVCRSATVGWGTAVYHLQRLERDQMIASRRDGQYRRFFLNGHAPEPGAEAPAERALRHPLALRIAQFLLANPGSAQKEVCAALGISPPLASKWLGRLLEAGLATSQREWKLVRYAPTPLLQQALAAAAPAGTAVQAGVPA